MSVQAQAAAKLNGLLRPLDVQIVRGRSDDAAVRPFLSARKTIAAARRSGLSLTDYIDQFSAVPGATASTVDAMLRIADLHDHVDRICEIGPGTGRYAELLIEALKPSVYEMYETATDWLPHLRRLPESKLLPADGHSLGQTASESVELVHAQKVFVYIPLIISVGYIYEMARVVRPGGTVAFDIVTEKCMDEEVTKEWLRTGATLYSMISRQWAVDLAAQLGLHLRGSAFVPLSGGRTELLVFRRTQSSRSSS
jgi:phospholipid N-methyltransferase